MFRLILFIFALSNVPAIQEETIFGVRQRELMTLSDALPVQFWLSECDTYNEHEAGGVQHECWCAPWECDDQIKIQFQDTPSSSRSLRIINEAGSTIATSPFSEVLPGVYQISLIPSDEDICDERVRFEIINPLSLLAPTSWTDTDSWSSKTANQFVISNSSSGSSRQPLLLAAGYSISFPFTINVTNADDYIVVQFSLLDGSFAEVGSYTTGQLPVGAYGLTASLTASSNASYLKIEGITGPAGLSYSYAVTIPVGLLNVVLAKSDCLDVATTQDETIFIEYSNHRNFDGLVYDNASPDLTFGIRVPCRFFHEIEPEEDEAMELTSSIVTTSGQVKTQRLLEVKHSPYYFHKKLRRILKHQNITIFDKSWKKEEPYDVLEGNKRWPLKAATCYLTEGNSVVRNVL